MSADGKTRLAIIGTAGRHPDGVTLAAGAGRYCERMLAAASRVADITSSSVLVSGGSAYADHVAVLLFLSAPDRFELELEVPDNLAPRQGGGMRFNERGETRDFRVNPGRSLNDYHAAFTKAMHRTAPSFSSFSDLEKVAGHPRAKVTMTFGMHRRNDVVARKSDHALAMTFGSGRLLRDGGTSYTMRQFLRRSTGQAFHLDLGTMRLWPNAQVSSEVRQSVAAREAAEVLSPEASTRHGPSSPEQGQFPLI